tara:strand:- start:62 stop:571 length:510 start_codon:yes stop_codon:yes gene_type:complete
MSGIIKATNLEVTTIKDKTNSNTAISIDTSGRVTQPQLVAWNVFRNATMSSSGDVTYTGSHLNVGTCVNLSTGVFTAPVAGNYLMTFACIGTGSATPNADVFLYLNGSKNAERFAMRPSNSNASENYSSNGDASAVMSLSANDEIKFNTNVALYSDGNNWIRFSGFLIG